MNSVIKFLHKTSFGLSVLILSFAFVVALGNVYASDFTFEHVHITNDGAVNSNIHTYSNTGGNTTTSNGESAVVQTGNAGSQTTIQNNVNTNIIEENCDCTPTPGQATPTLVSGPTGTPTPGSANNGGSSPSSNNGSSSSSSSGSSSPSQAVLGTMASTGTFEQNLMNLFAIAGLGLIVFSSLKLKRIV